MPLESLALFLLALIETYSLGVPVAYLPPGSKPLEELSLGKRGALLAFALEPRGEGALLMLRVNLLVRWGAHAPVAAEVLNVIARGLTSAGRMAPPSTILKFEDGGVSYGGHHRRGEGESEERFDIHTLSLKLAMKETQAAGEIVALPSSPTEKKEELPA